MARPQKRRISAGSSDEPTSSRTTPKGTRPDRPAESSRYTPPALPDYTPSPIWVPIVMFSLLGAGALAIFLNYTETLPSAPSGWYLIGGLGGILAGIMVATQLR